MKLSFSPRRLKAVNCKTLYFGSAVLCFVKQGVNRALISAAKRENETFKRLGLMFNVKIASGYALPLTQFQESVTEFLDRAPGAVKLFITSRKGTGIK